jgi:superfamily II DNA or RNA helicase
MLEDLRQEIGSGQRRIVVQAPTGYGKTLVSAAIVERAREKKKRVLFTVPALSLIDQTVQMFYSQGIYDVGVIQADHHMTDWSQPVQVASIQTLQKKKILPEADIVLLDECHRWFRFYEEWMTDPKWLKIPMIGLSATPWTKGMGGYYNRLLIASTTQELIDKGLLSDFKVFAPSHPDLKGIRTVGGDYDEGQLSERMRDAKLVADAVETWLKFGRGLPTLCYAVDCLHAQQLIAKFEAAGVRCAYQDAFTEGADRLEKKTKKLILGRNNIRKGFHDGSIEVVVSVGTLTTGIDWDVRCISINRPTKSEMLLVQIVGRGMRTAVGKDHLLILDHSSNHSKLGFVTEIDARHTTLHVGKTPASSSAVGIRLPKECPKCAYLKPPGVGTCPSCGFVVQAHCKIEPSPGELAELKKRKGKIEIDPAVFLSELKAYAALHGYKPGWAAMKYRDKLGEFPPRSIDGVAMAAGVSAATLSYIQSRTIAWAKSKFRRAPNRFVPGTLCTEEDLRDGFT